jgi:hypothetical protein
MRIPENGQDVIVSLLHESAKQLRLHAGDLLGRELWNSQYGQAFGDKAV